MPKIFLNKFFKLQRDLHFIPLIVSAFYMLVTRTVS